MPTRILLSDDPVLLGSLRADLESMQGFEVVPAGSTDEALELAVGDPAPKLAVLSAGGNGGVDGLAFARAVRGGGSGKLPVILVLPPGDTGRDACVLAGADEVVVAPVSASEVSFLAGGGNGTLPLRNAPRVAVTFQVNFQGEDGRVTTFQASQVSRESLLLIVPGEATPPVAGKIARVVFTLFEGGTLTVWTRVAPSSDPAVCVLRFVGLTSQEKQALDYFVEFYLKSAGPAEQRTAGAAASPPPEAASRPDGVSADGGTAATDQSLRLMADANLEALANLAADVLTGKGSLRAPPGFDLERVRASVARLPSAESSALRGTTMYNHLLGELRKASGIKVLAYEMTGQLKGGGSPKLSKKLAEQAVHAVIAEGDRIHGQILAQLEGSLKSGDTRTMRDLNPVQAGIVAACTELRNVLDRDVLGKAPPTPPVNTPAAAAGPVRYTKPVTQSGVAEPQSAQAAAKAPKSGGRRAAKPVFIVVAVVGLGIAAWANRGLFFGTEPQTFVAPSVEFSVGQARVWMSQTRPGSLRFVVDDSWKGLSEEERAAALDEFARRARDAGKPVAEVMDPAGAVLAVADAAESPSRSSP